MSITATYLVETDHPQLAITAITRGQSVGNPDILTAYETTAFLAKWCAVGSIEHNTQEGMFVINVRWPEDNFGREGLNYLLSVLMGGQCDVDTLKGCRLMEVELGHYKRFFPRPRYGMEGIRRLTSAWNRPLIGGIIKPKIGLTPPELAEVCARMADAGVDFIKEDEILADQPWCSMQARIPLVRKALRDFRTLYAPCITGDGDEVVTKAILAKKLGATALHLNLWCSLGAYVNLRRKVASVGLPIFFQKSGDKVWTTGSYSIDYAVICQLVYLAGCDFAHVGMYGGYLAEPIGVLQGRIQALHTTIPSFSCGMNPAAAEQIVHRFGQDIMLTSGGYIHGHAKGLEYAVKELKEASCK